MQDLEKLREIENLGEDDALFQEDDAWDGDRKEGGSLSGIPLLQAVICALAVLALIFFRISDDVKYQEITSWYQHEMSQELELPAFSRATPKPSQAPEPTATPVPSITASAPLQML